MEQSIQEWAKSLFDTIKHTDDGGIEYWLGRELADVLGYSWEGFERVIRRAELSVAETGQPVENHFRHVSNMRIIGRGNERPVDDVRLTRYACYIVAQNGNAAKKPAIAGAQAYFAIQTRKRELDQGRELDYERLIARQKFTDSDKRISEAVIEKGVSGRGLGEIKSSGDKVMFGGNTTAQMKKKYGITRRNTPLANRMPNVVLAAKTLANEMTAQNLADYPIEGFSAIKEENDGNNREVRKTLLIRSIVPEHLPPAEDTDMIMKRVKASDKKKTIEES